MRILESEVGVEFNKSHQSHLDCSRATFSGGSIATYKGITEATTNHGFDFTYINESVFEK